MYIIQQRADSIKSRRAPPQKANRAKRCIKGSRKRIGEKNQLCCTYVASIYFHVRITSNIFENKNDESNVFKRQQKTSIHSLWRKKLVIHIRFFLLFCHIMQFRSRGFAILIFNFSVISFLNHNGISRFSGLTFSR